MIGKKNNIVDFKHRRRESNQQVIERLFSEHGRALRTFLSGRVRGDIDIDDIIQEVFARLIRIENLQERLVYDSRSSRAFLFTAANNYLIDIERRRILEQNFKVEQTQKADQMVVEASPEKIAGAKEELLLIKRAIGGLRATWRKAFVLSRFEYLSYKQISEEMGISVKTVEKYITHALVQLREVTAREHRQGGRHD